MFALTGAKEFATEEEARKVRMKAAAEGACLESDDSGDDVGVTRVTKGDVDSALDGKVSTEENRRSCGCYFAAGFW